MADETDTDETAAGKDRRLDRDERFQAVVAERNKLRDQLAEAKSQMQTLTERAATADTLAQSLTKLEQQLKDEKASRAKESGLFEAGLTDPEDREMAEYHYAKLPGEGRPEIGDWLKQLKADPSKAPKALRASFGEPSKGAAETKGSAEQTAASGTAGGEGRTEAKGAPRTLRGVDSESAGVAMQRQPVSPEKLREVRTAASRTGDWSEWKRITGRAEASAKDAR